MRGSGWDGAGDRGLGWLQARSAVPLLALLLDTRALAGRWYSTSDLTPSQLSYQLRQGQVCPSLQNSRPCRSRSVTTHGRQAVRQGSRWCRAAVPSPQRPLKPLFLNCLPHSQQPARKAKPEPASCVVNRTMESKEPAVGTVPFELYLWLRRSPPEFSVRRCRASPMRHPSLSPSALCMPARCTMRENVWTTCAQRCADGPSAHLKSCTRQLHTPDSCLYLEMSARQCKLVLTGSSLVLKRGRRAHQPTSSPRKGLPWQPRALSRTSALVTSPARCVGGRRARNALWGVEQLSVAGAGQYLQHRPKEA